MNQTVEILPFIRKEPGTSLSRYTDYLTKLLVVFLSLPVIITSLTIKPFISLSLTHKCTPNNATVDLPLLNVVSYLHPTNNLFLWKWLCIGVS